MRPIEQHALFEIAMAVGNGTELRAMLQTSLSVMMRTLGCSMGVVVRAAEGGRPEVAHCIPYHVKDSTGVAAICQALDRAEIVFPANQPAVIEDGDSWTMVFQLPSFGALILALHGKKLSKPLLGDLTLIAKRLAAACIACEQVQMVREMKNRVQLLLNSTGEGIYGVDTLGRCTFANLSCLRLLGYQEEAELLGRSMHSLIHHTRADGTPYPEDQCRCNLLCQQGSPAHSNQPFHCDDEVFWRKDGNSFPVEYWSYPMLMDGKKVGSVVSFLDITSRAALERQRGYFTSITSHELCTPLATLRLGTSLLKRIEAANKDKDILDQVQVSFNKAISSLERVVSTATLIAEMTARHDEHPFTRYPIHNALVSSLQMARVQMGLEHRSVAIMENLAALPSQTKIRAKGEMVQRALEEVLSNAVKFTPDGKSVSVRAYVSGGAVCIEVRDEGEGIPPDKVREVFIPYFSLENPLAHSSGLYKFKGGGMGLGLTLAKLVLEYLGGILSIGKREDGPGTLITLHFPLADSPAGAAD